ncbi:adenosylcobinamide-GDP ribazoletransferase [Propionibacteriaceae bacterium G57]|uniref:adenosylcobinamide-GDP ribazoletransferase n=1 Tax=Aestuariimicrobium sp. G57 TaxID=3418485 RepID=UPI003DA74F7C
MRGFMAALGLFTTLPAPALARIDKATARRAMSWFPAVGLLLGVLAGAVFGLVSWLSMPLLGAVAAVGVLALATGGLHLDGVADTADGLGSRRPADEALVIMKRSDIGPMGVLALVFVVLLDIAALVSLAGVDGWLGAVALVLAAATGRLAVVFATAPGRPSARPGGFGSLFEGAGSPVPAAAWTILLAAGAVGSGWWIAGPGQAVALAGGVVVPLVVGRLWQRYLRRRLGGLTGDTFGSIIEVTQATGLVVMALVAP